MPERTKEELQQIYDDLLEFKETLNWLNTFGDLWPTPLNGKTWEEEKNKFWNRGINAFDDLAKSGKVESCEIRTLCEYEMRFSQNRKGKQGFWNHVAYHPNSSSEYYLGSRYSLDEFIERIGNIINNDTATKREELIINEILDDIGTTACEPRAFIQNDMENTLTYEIELGKPRIQQMDLRI